ncbi:MAG: AI-2E family transporter [bacterium]|nr:AI-2E family transporter [bacterium]
MAPSLRPLTILLGILTTIMLGWVLHVGAEILQPLVIALLLASMLQPLVVALARKRIPPGLTVITLVTLLFLGLAQVGLLLQANVVSFLGVPVETTSTAPLDPMSKEQGELSDRLGGWSGVKQNIRARMERSSLPEPVTNLLHSSLDKIDRVRLEAFAPDLIGGGFDFVKSLLLVVIYMVFIFAEQAVFRRKILSIAGERREVAVEVLDTMGRGIQRYLGVKTVASFATGALCYAVLVFLEIPYALLFGFLTFLLNYIPTFGSIIAGLFPTITALAVEESWSKALVVIVTYLTVNLTIGSYLEPKVLGRELDLSPLVIIVSVVVWAGLWGVVGAFLAVPLTSTLQIVLASQENTRPIAIMLSSGPPRERRPRGVRRKRRSEGSSGRGGEGRFTA